MGHLELWFSDKSLQYSSEGFARERELLLIY